MGSLISYPRPGHNSGAVTNWEHELLAAVGAPDGVFGAPGDPPVVYADGTGGLAVKIRAGKRGRLRGSVWDTGDSDIVVPLAANTSGSPRIDLIVARLDRPSGYEVTEHVITGTPASSPTVPSPTRQITPSGVYDLPLAAVRVEPGASAITGDKVTPLHWWLGNDGQIRCTSSTRPPHSAGLTIWEDGRLLVSTGTQWRAVSEETGWVNGAAASGWSASVFQVRRTGRLVESRIQVMRTGGDLSPGADVQIGTIPVGYRPTGLLWILGFSDGNQLARVRAEADGRLILINHGGIKRGHTLTLQSTVWRAA